MRTMATQMLAFLAWPLQCIVLFHPFDHFAQYLFTRPVILMKCGQFLAKSYIVFKHFAHSYNVVNIFSLSLPIGSSTCAFFGPENKHRNRVISSGGTLRQDNCQLIGQSLIVLARQAQKRSQLIGATRQT